MMGRLARATGRVRLRWDGLWVTTGRHSGCQGGCNSVPVCRWHGARLRAEAPRQGLGPGRVGSQARPDSFSHGHGPARPAAEPRAGPAGRGGSLLP